ncbi:hypothetical protein IAT38_002844 [Cryptococcus sp. DSM 104549]
MDDPLMVAGPSRPRRREEARDSDDLGSRIAALQRQNAALVGSVGGVPRPASKEREREKDRDRERRRPPGSPSSSRRPPPSPAGHSSLPSRPRERDNEFSRGAPGPSSTPRVLFDPSKPAPPAPKPERATRVEHEERDTDRERDRERRRRVEVRREVVPASRGKKLFDPAVHDPQAFSPRLAPASDAEGSAGSRGLMLRRTPGTGSASASGSGRTAEVDADRERDRRRRKEGSERGSLPKKKEGDTKSKGSKSSEGSESFKDRERGKGRNDTGVKPILKKIHDEIKELEQELIEVHRKMAQDPEAGIAATFDRKVDAYSRSSRSASDDAAAWVRLISKHKKLAELHDNFLITLYDPLVPSSYHQLSVKYNIASRLWQTGFFLLLEQLRHAWLSHQPSALDLLTDVVYDAYRFYSEMLENQALAGFRSAWIEALGDLARYRMTIASHVAEAEARRERAAGGGGKGKGRADDGWDDEESERGNGGAPVPSGASIGAEVAQSWDVEDKETWRMTARDWYTMGITEKPGEGRLHHHLALLCRDVKRQEGRALYHFVKSLTVTHEFATSRESILPLFDTALQSQRSLPEATAMDLFVRLHGMLFTRIELDNFPSVMSRYMERLEEDASLDGVSRKATITQVDWMIMASVNIAAVLQYGASSGLVRKALAQEGAERRKAQAQAADEEGDGDEMDVGGAEAFVPSAEYDADEPPPITFTYSLQLAFSVLSFVLAHPNRIQGFHQVLNPYLTIFLTFLCTLFRQPHVGSPLLAHVPWHALARFVNAANLELVEEKRLATGAPLPEDWLIRGSEWVGRRVYERGFWKGKAPGGSGGGRGSSGMIAQPRVGERFQSEMDVLLANFDTAVDIQEGVVEEVEGTDLTDGPVAVSQRRWKRVAWAVGVLGKHVEGLGIREGKLVVEEGLEEKIREVERKKEEEERKERDRVERKRREREEDSVELLEWELEDGEEDQDLAELRRRLMDLRAQTAAPAAFKAKRPPPVRRAIQPVPGYTMLIFDTNVLVDSLAMVTKIVEGGQWTVVVPLPVVTELDGLSKEPGLLGDNAKIAVAALEERIRTYSLCLKIQTTKGNYLSDLLIRTEQFDSHPADSADTIARTMDDRIVHIAGFAQDNFTDRSVLLGMPRAEPGATKVLLVSNDRNMRLKARARGLEVVDEKELRGILAKA